jgi:hypothetical protein
LKFEFERDWVCDGTEMIERVEWTVQERNVV